MNYKLINKKAFDVGSKTLLHAHAFGFDHIPIGTSLASLIGGLDAILSL